MSYKFESEDYARAEELLGQLSNVELIQQVVLLTAQRELAIRAEMNAEQAAGTIHELAIVKRLALARGLLTIG